LNSCTAGCVLVVFALVALGWLLLLAAALNVQNLWALTNQSPEACITEKRIFARFPHFVRPGFRST
jgi:hypothetical protein